MTLVPSGKKVAAGSWSVPEAIRSKPWFSKVPYASAEVPVPASFANSPRLTNDG